MNKLDLQKPKLAKCCGTCGCCEEESDGYHGYTVDWLCHLQHTVYVDSPYEIKDCYQEPVDYGSGNCKNCYLYKECVWINKDSKPTYFCGKWKQGLKHE